jgi:hypothetical protein
MNTEDDKRAKTVTKKMTVKELKRFRKWNESVGVKPAPHKQEKVLWSLFSK